MCDTEWNGGCGYFPEDIGRLTPDQIYFRLCDKRLLQQRVGYRTGRILTDGIHELADKDGFIKGRAADGSPIKLKASKDGKSYAAYLAEKEKEQKQQQSSRKRRRNRRGT